MKYDFYLYFLFALLKLSSNVSCSYHFKIKGKGQVSWEGLNIIMHVACPLVTAFACLLEDSAHMADIAISAIHHSPFTIHHPPSTIHHSPFTVQVCKRKREIEDKSGRKMISNWQIQVWKKTFPNLQKKNEWCNFWCYRTRSTQDLTCG